MPRPSASTALLSAGAFAISSAVLVEQCYAAYHCATGRAFRGRYIEPFDCAQYIGSAALVLVASMIMLFREQEANNRIPDPTDWDFDVQLAQGG
jgi:hypothetical protein